MDIRKFRAPSLQEALQQVRSALGPNAAVLEMRDVPGSSTTGSDSEVEVDATVDFVAANGSAYNVTQRGAEHTSREPTRPLAVRLQTDDSSCESTLPSGSLPHSMSGSTVSVKEASQAEVISGDTEPDLESNQTLLALEAKLIQQEIPAGHAKQIVLAAHHRAAGLSAHDVEVKGLDIADEQNLLKEMLIELVSEQLPIVEPIQLIPGSPTIVAFVGPTGGGKTSCLSKIAANFRMDIGCQVGFMTLDTFRLGAVDQLLQVAEQLAAPLEVLSAPEQAQPAIERLQACDLILLDTAGRSTSDHAQLNLLHEMLAASHPHVVQLVVSCTSSVSYARQVMDSYSVLNPTHLLISKLDELMGFGSWLPLLTEAELPISYSTSGQHFSSDLKIVEPRHLATALLGF